MRILILEDDPIIALDLQMLIEHCGHDTVVCETNDSARRRLGDALDFAFLDVDLPDGKSFEVADRLQERRVPFCFVSGSRRCDMPEHLRHALFISKPYHQAAIRNTLAVGVRLAS